MPINDHDRGYSHQNIFKQCQGFRADRQSAGHPSQQLQREDAAKRKKPSAREGRTSRMASAPDRIVRLPLTRHPRRFHRQQPHHSDDMADDGVYLAPADDAPCTVDSVRLLTDQEEHGQLQHVTLPQILYTASVLVKQRNCPVDVVNGILEFAGMLLSFHNETEQRVYGRDNMNDEYLRLDLPSRDELTLPAGIAASKCVFLAVECVSKDQGWASFQHELNGTYYGSCTWLEVAVEKPAGAVAAPEEAQASGDSTKAARSSPGGDDHQDPDGAPTVAGDEAIGANKVEVARVPALYNVRAHRNFRHHLKCFQDPKGLIHHIELGDSVRLMLRSEYPGWSNSAKFGKLSAFFALEFDEEFSFADVPFPESTNNQQHGGSAGNDDRFTCNLQ